VLQPNQRWRVLGVRDGVEIMAIITFDGAVTGAWPLVGGRGVQQNPSWSISREETVLVETMKDLPGRFSDHLCADDTGRFPPQGHFLPRCVSDPCWCQRQLATRHSAGSITGTVTNPGGTLSITDPRTGLASAFRLNSGRAASLT